MLQNAGFLRRRSAGMHNWNWDDLRFVAVLAEVGTIAEAARRLNVNRTTVQRRIAAFEDQLSYRLFSRDSWGLKPLPEAGPILDAAREIGEALVRIERKTSSSDQAIAGELSLTTPDDLYLAGISDAIAALQHTYPALKLKLSITTRPLDLDKREAEIAIRPSMAPPEHLVARRICDLCFHPYASRDYIERTGTVAADAHRWLCLQPAFSAAPSETWLSRNIPTADITLRADSYLAVAEAARRGLGVAILPAAYADKLKGLQRVDGLMEDRLVVGLWLLTHPDFRQSPRVKTAMDLLAEKLKPLKARLES